jgi:two-component system, OmpR family, phosphate regulon response regulator PhoB
MPDRTDSSHAPDASPLASRTVLVVDDDALVLMGLQMMLETWELTVLAASDLAGVRQHLSAGTPDLVLTDLRLSGGLSGFDVVDEVRSHTSPMLPALVLTGDTGEAGLAEGHRRNVAFLHKPIQPEELRRAIVGALG